MKKTWKRLLALLLVFTLMAGMLPARAFSQDDVAEEAEAAGSEAVAEEAEDAFSPEENVVGDPEDPPYAT